MSRLECLTFGALGGMCPTLAHLASFYATKPGSDLPELGLFIGLALFAVLGSVIAVGFGAKEVKAAVVAGIAAPGIVSNIAAGAAAEAKRADAETAAISFFVGAAYAQTDTVTGIVIDPAIYGDSRAVRILPTIKGGAPDGLNLPVTAVVTVDGTETQVPVSAIHGDTAQTIVVPKATTALLIGTTLVPIGETHQSVDVVIETAPSIAGDFLWALGAQRSYSVRDVDLTAR
ncbi:MAG: hypothetical protein R3E44_12650 [Paracoccaceae bacterium]